MRRFRNLSIRTKVVLLTVGSVCIALSLCSAGFITTDLHIIRAAKIRELQSLEDVLGFNSSAVRAFRDPAAAERLLAALSLQPTVTCGCLYDGAGKILARYSPHGLEPPPLARAMRGVRGVNAVGDLELFHPVVEDGRLVGALYLSASMADFRAQFQYYLLVAGVVLICSLAAAVLFSVRLQSSISAPILRLAAIARKVCADRDYSVRVGYEASDEVGELCRAFDRMLAQVESSETALRAAHNELEERVTQRTAELEQEIARSEHAQAELERAKDAAEAANQAKSRFLANMSHEIRTPLNAILGFTDLLRRGADGGREAERREYLDTIDASGKHLLSLINDILDLSRIEADQLDLTRAPCSPNHLIAEAISVLRVRAAEKGLYLHLEWESLVPATIETDAFRLRQLLVNLLSNAVKFTRTGGVTVKARLLQTETPPQLQIQVIDTGVGIAPEKLEDIFNPFVQADNSVTREFGGTGLGLAISRRIVEALGGRLEVQSQVDRGSTFTVTISAGTLEGVELLEPAAADAVAAARPRETNEVISLPATRVLLVEDGAVNRKLISLLLTRAGVQVMTAENGQIAVELVAQHPFDVILMDMQMPVMDGYSAAAHIRRQGFEVPIIALTAHAMKGDEEKCRAAGCTGYLAKPVNPADLFRTLTSALGQRGQSTAQATAVKPPVADGRIVSSLPTGDLDFREIVEEYVGVLGAQIESMRVAWAGHQRDELARQAHRLKGSAGTAGFAQFTMPAHTLEQFAKAEQWDEAGKVLSEIAALAKLVWLPWRDPQPASSS
jgi:signal transduction histidine kinase/HPt (histidine-containing phosphotransfer) domain-containing protein/ActR/RegA family two-component response regulator